MRKHGGGIVSCANAQRIGFTAAVFTAFLACAARDAAAGYISKTLFELQPPPGVTLTQFGYSGGAQSAESGEVVGLGAGPGTANNYNALLWAGSSAAIDLHPTGYTSSALYATDGIGQVGEATTDSSDSNDHAMVWYGNSATATDLNPSGYSTSTAEGIYGGQQVGFAYLTGSTTVYHAMLWTGTASSAIDLHPAGYTQSLAVGTDFVNQVGRAVTAAGYQHAILWSGQASSAIDLNPSGLGFLQSNALGVGGNQEVGFGGLGNNLSALLWTGSASSAINLNPTGFTSSVAYATNGTHQVGYAGLDAYVWSGSAASGINLESLLPTYLVNSRATSIDSAGDIYGIAEDSAGNEYAVEWVSVPEPTAFGLLVLVVPSLLLKRRRIPTEFRG